MRRQSGSAALIVLVGIMMVMTISSVVITAENNRGIRALIGFSNTLEGFYASEMGAQYGAAAAKAGTISFDGTSHTNPVQSDWVPRYVAGSFTVEAKLDGTVCGNSKLGDGKNSFAICLEDELTAGLMRHYDPKDIDADHTVNSGSISGETEVKWGDLVNGFDANLGTFTGAAGTGWQGDGSAADPYRLGTSATQVVDGGILGPAQTYSIWINPKAVWAPMGDPSIMVKGYNSLPASQFLMSHGILLLRYMTSAHWTGTGITTGEWQHAVMTNNGTKTDFYMNGWYLGSATGGKETQTLALRIAQNAVYPSYDGYLGEIRVYNKGLPERSVRAIYEKTRPDYLGAEAATKATRMSPAVGPSLGGTVVRLTGWNLDTLLTVKVDGASATDLKVLSMGTIEFTTPAGSVGKKDVVLTFGNSTSLTLTKAFEYSAISTDQAQLIVDFSNPKGIGAPTAGYTTKMLHSLVNGKTLGIVDPSTMITFPGANPTTSYWTATDYMTAAHLSASVSFSKTHSIWFKHFNTWIPMGHKNIFHVGGNPGTTSARISMNHLTGFYNGYGNAFNSGVRYDEWYHFVMSHDGTKVRYFLNGLPVDQRTCTAEANIESLYVGNIPWSGGTRFTGEMGEYRQYGRTFTDAEVLSLYGETRDRYLTASSTAKVERVVPAISALAGGGTVNLYGHHLDRLTSVNFGAAAGTSLVKISPEHATVVVPAGAAGRVDIVIATSDGTVTLTKAFRYSAAPTLGLRMLLDPASPNGIGPVAPTNGQWPSLVSNRFAGLIGFPFPATAAGGWKGDGTAAQGPYRWDLDGTNHLITLGDEVAQTYSFWFKATQFMHPMNFRRLLVTGNMEAYYTNTGTLAMWYAGDSAMTKALALNTWYHAVITRDGTSTRYYLNGVLERTGAGGPPNTSRAASFYGSNWSGALTHQGSLGELRMYDGALSDAEVTALYNETLPDHIP